MLTPDQARSLLHQAGETIKVHSPAAPVGRDAQRPVKLAPMEPDLPGWLVPAAAAALLAAVLGLGFVLLPGGDEGSSSDVQSDRFNLDLVGLTLPDAVETAQEAGLEVRLERPSTCDDLGWVTEQRPAAEAGLMNGDTVTLVSPTAPPNVRCVAPGPPNSVAAAHSLVRYARGAGRAEPPAGFWPCVSAGRCDRALVELIGRRGAKYVSAADCSAVPPGAVGLSRVNAPCSWLLGYVAADKSGVRVARALPIPAEPRRIANSLREFARGGAPPRFAEKVDLYLGHVRTASLTAAQARDRASWKQRQRGDEPGPFSALDILSRYGGQIDYRPAPDDRCFGDRPPLSRTLTDAEADGRAVTLTSVLIDPPLGSTVNCREAFAVEVWTDEDDRIMAVSLGFNDAHFYTDAK